MYFRKQYGEYKWLGDEVNQEMSPKSSYMWQAVADGMPIYLLLF